MIPDQRHQPICDPPNYWLRSISAVFIFFAFVITIPPLGFMGFLDAVGLLGDPTGFFETIGKGDRQEAMTGGIIFVYGGACVGWVLARNQRVCHILGWILVFISTSSLGGCAMMLAGLNGIGG